MIYLFAAIVAVAVAGSAALIGYLTHQLEERGRGMKDRQ